MNEGDTVVAAAPACPRNPACAVQDEVEELSELELSELCDDDDESELYDDDDELIELDDDEKDELYELDDDLGQVGAQLKVYSPSEPGRSHTSVPGVTHNPLIS